MEIISKGSYPANKLSNFSPNKFIFDGVECNSIEGVLQAFKFEGEISQRQSCLLVGFSAKKNGSKRNKYWTSKQTLWWNGKGYPRKSKEYQELITRLYDTVFEQCQSFRDALKATGNAVLKHSIGRNNESETVLTEREFIRQLNRLREKL